MKKKREFFTEKVLTNVKTSYKKNTKAPVRGAQLSSQFMSLFEGWRRHWECYGHPYAPLKGKSNLCVNHSCVPPAATDCSLAI